MKLVYFGTPEFAVEPLMRLMQSGHEILAVVTQPDRQSGRGRKMKPCPVKVEAEKAGLRVLQPLKVRDSAFIDELREIGPSVIVVAAYGQILPSEIIHMPGYGCVNIHGSLLPKYRGAAPVNWAIINGESVTGITTMLMDEGMDTGPELLREEVPVSPDDTAGSLLRKLSACGADLLIPTLEGLERGNVKPKPQEGEPSYAPILKKEDGRIKWSKPAEELSNFIRGMNPWPGAYSYVEGERIKILRAVPLHEEGEAGVIMTASREALNIGTGKGQISVREIQPSGKPVMPVRAFLQGRRLREGMRFDLKND